jgi:hypothetical protein
MNQLGGVEQYTGVWVGETVQLTASEEIVRPCGKGNCKIVNLIK